MMIEDYFGYDMINRRNEKLLNYILMLNDVFVLRSMWKYLFVLF